MLLGLSRMVVINQYQYLNTFIAKYNKKLISKIKMSTLPRNILNSYVQIVIIVIRISVSNKIIF